MKASDKPQVSKKWWTSEKPADIKGADLEKALASAEKALADEQKTSDANSVDACIVAMNQLESAVEKTLTKECDKKKHKDCIAVLEKFEDLIANQIERLEEAQAELEDGGEDDEEEDENKLFEKDCLYRMIKLVKSGTKELRFGFGLNTQEPEASKLVLTRKGKPEKLFKLLKRTGDFSNRTLTYGFAAPDPEQKKTLVFRLEESAGEPPQVIKLGRRFLRADKSLYFRKLKLVMPGGQTVVDDEPDTEDGEAAAAAAGGADLSKELGAVQNLAAAWQQVLSDVSKQIANLRKAIDAQNDAALQGVSYGLGNVRSQFPDLDLSKLVAAAKSNDRAAYDRTLAQTAKEVRDVRSMLADGPLLATIDENPFVKTNVHATVKSVLERVSNELNMKA